jgi:hypothetical protein
MSVGTAMENVGLSKAPFDAYPCSDPLQESHGTAKNVV